MLPEGLGSKVLQGAMALSRLNQRPQMISGAVGVADDQTFDNQRRFAGDDGVDRFPVGAVRRKTLHIA